MVDNLDYVRLGLSCADVCRALGRGINGKKLDEFSQPVYDATGQLALWVGPATRTSNCPLIRNTLNHRTVADIQKKLVKWGKRNMVSRRFHAKEDKETIVAWRLDLERILRAFKVRSVT
jgi:hypothetical protein